MKYITILLLLILVSSCSSTKRLQRAINNMGQREALAWAISHYPEYVPKGNDSLIKVEIPPTLIYIPDTTNDTTFSSALDSFVYENNFLRVQLNKTQDRLNYTLRSTRKAIHDTLISPPKIITVEGQKVFVPCPEEKKSWWNGGVLSLIILAIILALTYAIIRLFKK